MTFISMKHMEELIRNLSQEQRARKDIITSLKKLNVSSDIPIKKLILMKNEVANVRKKLDKANLKESYSEEIHEFLTGFDSEIIRTENLCKSSFGTELHDQLAELNITYEGQYPKYSLYGGLLYITSDLSANKTKLFYGNEREKIAECKTDPEVITKMVMKNKPLIFDREFDEESFLLELKNAYDICIFKNKSSRNSNVKIVDLLPEVAFIKQNKRFRNNPSKSQYKEYTKVQFSYDISQLKARTVQNSELRLIAAKRSDTRNSRNIIWIPSKTRSIGETISGIKFVEQNYFN